MSILRKEILNITNLLLEDIEKFNKKLMDYLVWYIRERSHESLNNKPAEQIAGYRRL